MDHLTLIRPAGVGPRDAGSSGRHDQQQRRRSRRHHAWVCSGGPVVFRFDADRGAELVAQSLGAVYDANAAEAWLAVDAGVDEATFRALFSEAIYGQKCSRAESPRRLPEDLPQPENMIRSPPWRRSRRRSPPTS